VSAPASSVISDPLGCLHFRMIKEKRDLHRSHVVTISTSFAVHLQMGYVVHGIMSTAGTGRGGQGGFHDAVMYLVWLASAS
jgi:hypothetical protein